MGEDEFSINLDSPNGVYFAGDVVSGTLALRTSETFTGQEMSVALFGTAQCWWTEQASPDGGTSHCYGNQLHFGQIRTPVNAGLNDNAGRTVFTFSFTLPIDAPGSAEVCLNNWIRYNLLAYVDAKNDKAPTREMTISVIPNRPVPTLELLAPTETKLLDKPMYNKCCGCNCSRIPGLVSVVLVTDRRSYAVSDTIDISGSTVVNDSNEPLLVRIQLRLYIYRKCRSRSPRTGFNSVILFRGECPSNSRVDVSSLVNRQLRMPNGPPSYNGGNDPPQICLKWTYVLVLKVGGEGKTGVSACLPILLSCAPPYAQAVESAKSLAVSGVYDSPFSVLDAAINGLDSCDTTPYLSRSLTNDAEGSSFSEDNPPSNIASVLKDVEDLFQARMR